MPARDPAAYRAANRERINGLQRLAFHERRASLVADIIGPTKLDGWIAKNGLRWAPEAIASAIGVSRRTAARWKAEIVGLEDVEVGGFVAPFVIRRGKPPIRVGAWQKAGGA